MKTTTLFLTPFVASLLLASLASAQTGSVETNNTLQIHDAVRVNGMAQLTVKTENRGSTTSSSVRQNGINNASSGEERKDNNGTSTGMVKKDARATSTTHINSGTSTEIDTKGQVNASLHRSVVASFVQTLLNVADRESGIGSQVRNVAKTQNDSASTTVSALVKVEERGSLKTFFLGADYKNLGVIRSELATTSNTISQLKSLLAQVTNEVDRMSLSAQIQVLEAEQVKLDAYIAAHEDVFSLFGWLTKRMVK